jgi:mono/diheme cytochrome c family protein
MAQAVDMSSKRFWSRVVGVSALSCALAASGADLRAQQSRTVGDGVYSAAQATRGQGLFKETCASCHGPALAGLSAPPLTGPSFLENWSPDPLADLLEKIQKTMPETAPGSLTRAQAADILAFILQTGKFPAGTADLSADEAALKLVRWPAGGSAPAAAASAAGTPSLKGLPMGTLAQVMRGIFFPSSNIIFNAQGTDPGAPKPAFDASANKGGFSWVDWQGGIYSGWQVVDFAAVALAEAAQLMLTPGRKCENGRPVPIEREDWKKYTQDMVDAGAAAYKASQTRNQDAVIEATNAVSDACLNCHVAYRDKEGGTAADPSNKAARCIP